MPAIALAPILAIGTLFSSRQARGAWARLLFRSRWLLGILVMTTALMTPGESAWPGVPVTQEGLQFAADQLSRLLFVLFAVAWLLTRWPAPVFAGAICNLASRSGVDAARRAAARLALTLQVIGAADRARPLWREVIAETSMPPSAMQETPAIAFEDMPLGAWNRLVLSLALAATTGLWWVLP